MAEMEKLYLNGENKDGEHVLMDGLGFIKAINHNGKLLGAETSLDLDTHNTPEHLVKAFKEQTGGHTDKDYISYKTPGGPDDYSTSKEPSKLSGYAGGIYNMVVEDKLGEGPEPGNKPGPISPACHIDFSFIGDSVINANKQISLTDQETDNEVSFTSKGQSNYVYMNARLNHTYDIKITDLDGSVKFEVRPNITVDNSEVEVRVFEYSNPGESTPIPPSNWTETEKNNLTEPDEEDEETERRPE